MKVKILFFSLPCFDLIPSSFSSTLLVVLKVDGELADGTARYPEYPDTIVERGLAKEGLADWDGALQDYTKAIQLWGG